MSLHLRQSNFPPALSLDYYIRAISLLLTHTEVLTISCFGDDFSIVNDLAQVFPSIKFVPVISDMANPWNDLFLLSF